MARHFVFYALDRSGMAGVRAAARDRHRAYIRTPRADCRCVAGGPLLDPAGAAMIGTLLVFDARDLAAVERFVADDPYTRAGLFDTVDIRPWAWGLGAVARPAADDPANPIADVR